MAFLNRIPFPRIFFSIRTYRNKPKELYLYDILFLQHFDSPLTRPYPRIYVLLKWVPKISRLENSALSTTIFPPNITFCTAIAEKVDGLYRTSRHVVSMRHDAPIKAFDIGH